MIGWQHLERLMWEYGLEVRNRYRNALATRRINASGRLSASIEPLVKNKAGVFTLYMAFTNAPYWKYIEDGTRTAVGHQQGHRPPVGPFLEWVKAKGIPYGRRGPLPVAYAVAYKVWKTGTLPKNVLGQATYDADQATQRMEQAAEADIEIWLANLIDNVKI